MADSPAELPIGVLPAPTVCAMALQEHELETMARVHVFYEVSRLVLPSRVPVPSGLVYQASDMTADVSEWLGQTVLESVLVHMRCVYAFLTGIGRYPTDVVAADYFREHWTAPAVVIGVDAADQRRVLDNINKRLHHIGEERLVGPYVWTEATKHTGELVTAFRNFVDDLASDGDGSRAGWFRAAVSIASYCGY